MIAMMDEIFDRQYQSGRNELNAGLDRAFGTVGREFRRTFQLFHDIQWSAPWLRKPATTSKDVGCA